MPATNWWVHRYVQPDASGNLIRTFSVNHASFPQGEAMSPSNSIGHATIEQAEVALGLLGEGFGSGWYIHRKGKPGSALRTYDIDQDNSNVTCPNPAGGGYASTLEIANGLHLSALHNINACNYP